MLAGGRVGLVLNPQGQRLCRWSCELLCSREPRVTGTASCPGHRTAQATGLGQQLGGYPMPLPLGLWRCAGSSHGQQGNSRGPPAFWKHSGHQLGGGLRLEAPE